MNKIKEFHKFFNRFPGLWWLSRPSLANFVTSRRLEGIGNYCYIDTVCDPKKVKQFCESRGVEVTDGDGMAKPVLEFEVDGKEYCYVCFKLSGTAYMIKCGTAKATATPEEIKLLKKQRRMEITNQGLWKVNIIKDEPYYVQLPYKFGTYLDNMYSQYKGSRYWWRDLPKGEDNDYRMEWFTPERKQNGYELLNKMLEAGERAGIRDKMFLSFGNLLGYANFGDFIKHDNDLDIGIDQERTTRRQDLRYIEEMRKPFTIDGKEFPHGLCEKEFRKSNLRTDTDRPLWVSVGHRSIMKDNGVKSCNWWFFKHGGYYWHSKGDLWVEPGKFHNVRFSPNAQSAAKGMPEHFLDELVEIDFHGVQINVPKKVGHCLDWWYPGWFPGGKGSSASTVLMEISDWNKKKDWKMYFEGI